MEEKLCPKCKTPVLETSYFCPNCGKKIKEPSPSTTVGKQIGIYALSVFAPPFGLVPGFRYLFQKDTKTQIIGMVAIVLTVISTIITVWLSYNFFNTINQQISSQLGPLQNPGF